MIRVSNTGIYHSGSNASITGIDDRRDFFHPARVLPNMTFFGGVSFGADMVTNGRYVYDLDATKICNQMEVFTSGISEWTVPAGVTSITAYVVGGGGGAGYGYGVSDGGRGGSTSYYPSFQAGLGGVVKSTRAVSAGQVFQLIIGAGGTGNNSNRGSSGGASTMSLPNSSSIWLTAPGGGGSLSNTASTNGNAFLALTEFPKIKNEAILVGVNKSLYFVGKTDYLTLTGNTPKIYEPSDVFLPGSAGRGQARATGRGGMGGAIFIMYGQP